MYIHIHIHTHTQIWMYTCIYTCIYTYVYTYIYTDIDIDWRRRTGYHIFIGYFLQKSHIISGSFAETDLQFQGILCTYPTLYTYLGIHKYTCVCIVFLYVDVHLCMCSVPICSCIPVYV